MISMSAPYMLHLQPVIIPSTAPDIRASEVFNSDDLDYVYKSVEDGMEHIFTSTTQLRFGHDLRLNEVRRLLCSARPVPIQTPTNPSVSDQDLHQQQLWNFAQRTTALPFGRGAFTLATTYTLLTEVLVFPKLVLAGRLPAQQNATVNLDLSSRSVSEFKSWAEFHNGVAAGLRLAPFQEKMLRTWIQYNRPSEPNFTHAGLLLAFGLHEHLRVLTVTDAYGYLSQEHDITTLGLLLGLAASHRGTMDPAISKGKWKNVPPTDSYLISLKSRTRKRPVSWHKCSLLARLPIHFLFSVPAPLSSPRLCRSFKFSHCSSATRGLIAAADYLQQGDDGAGSSSSATWDPLAVHARQK